MGAARDGGGGLWSDGGRTLRRASSSSYVRRAAARPLVAYAGRLSPEKGVSDILGAMARVADRGVDVDLVIAGDCASSEAVRAEAAGLGLTPDVFAGHVPHAEMDGLFARIWALVLPARWAEPFGDNCVLEALVRGVPVITTDGGGPAELVEHERTGLLVPPGDVEALAVAIEAVATGEAFPSRSIDEEARRRLLVTFDASAHTRRLRWLLAGESHG